jgi:glutaredoxin
MKSLRNHHHLWLLLTATAVASSGAMGESVYRSISPDGRVVYSDQPPSTGKVQKVYSFDNLPASPVPAAVQRFRQELESSMTKKLSTKSTSTTGNQLFVASWCGYCRKAKAYLNERGIPYQETDIDTPEGGQRFALAGGGGGIPLLFSNGQRLQGFSAPAYDALFRSRK